MEKSMIYDLIDRYIQITHDVWKRGEALIKDEISDELTNDQLYLLRYIYKREKCTTTKLADAFFVQKSAITAIITRLVEKNIITRIPDQLDRRVVYLTLTDEGKALFEKTEAKVFDVVESFITKFDQEEINNFIQTYEKLGKILKEMCSNSQ